jgi:ATP-dependent DNA helicase RecQ
MLKVLDVEGAVEREGSTWHTRRGSGWAYDAERYARITELRRREQAAMAQFGADGRCLMRALQEELDDPSPQDCGRCAVCTAARYDGPLDPELVRAAALHLRARPLELETKKMAPDAEGRMRKIPDDVRVEPGFALARFGDGGWWPAIERGLTSGTFEPEVIKALADAVRRTNLQPKWIAHVPSTRVDATLRTLTEQIAAALDIDALTPLTRRESRPPQREMANAAQQVANVRGAFAVTQPPPPTTGVLLDDRRHSGWTLAMVGGQLRRAGAQRIIPLALATLN